MIGLTSRQAACAAAVKKLTVGGVAPSFAELRSELGLSSNSGVHRLLNALQERGALTYLPKRARSVRLVEARDALERRSTDDLLRLRARIDAILARRVS